MSNETKTPTTVCGESTVVGETIKGEQLRQKENQRWKRIPFNHCSDILYHILFQKSNIFCPIIQIFIDFFKK